MLYLKNGLEIGNDDIVIGTIIETMILAPIEDEMSAETLDALNLDCPATTITVGLYIRFLITINYERDDLRVSTLKFYLKN